MCNTLSKYSPVMLVVIVPVAGLLLGAAVAPGVDCNKHKAAGEDKLCNADYPDEIYCTNRDEASCQGSLGAQETLSVPLWKRECDDLEHTAWDHCVVEDSDCLPKYKCKWDAILKYCDTWFLDPQGAYFQEDRATSPSCDPTS